MFCLHVQAPFATFRSFTAGSFRPTAPFITPSAAYGLLLNLAGVEMRAPDDGKSSMTRIRQDLPAIEIALGALNFPDDHAIFQQLHNYPVGTSGENHAPKTKGSKYNVVPARRAFLTGIDAYLCVRGNPKLEDEIRHGLAGKRRRYGLPFLGDNNFLLDRADLVNEADIQPAYWFVRLDAAESSAFAADVARLTITIDRVVMSRTRSQLFRPTRERTTMIPDKGCWTEVRYG